MSVHVFLPDHQGIPVVVDWQIPLFVAEEVGLTGLRLIRIGEVAEFKALILKSGFVHLGFSVRIVPLQDTAVSAQDVIDIPHKIGPVAVVAVVEGGSAFW